MPSLESILAHARTGDMMREVKASAHAGIERCPDYDRVFALEARPTTTPEQIEQLSAYLRHREWGIGPDGQPQRNELRQLQAMLLREAFEIGGAFGPIKTGGGKTLPSLLAPTLLGAQRPVLIVPANLRAATRRAYAKLLPEWKVRIGRLLSYEEISHPNNAGLLDQLRPDLLILDEAHKAANELATCSTRIERCIEDHSPRVIAMSGSLIGDELLHARRFALWALRDRAPVPVSDATAERWASAVDRDIGSLRRTGAGILDELPGGDFWSHFRTRRGVVPVSGTTGDDDCDRALTIQVWQPTLSLHLTQTIDGVLASRMRPDGELLSDLEIPDVTCMLSQGFYQVWDPLPPSWWINPRRAWLGYVRDVLLQRLRGLDSPAMIAMALDRPSMVQPPDADVARQLLALWREVEPRFEPNPVPVWIDDSPLREVADRARPRPGTLVWVKHTAAGEKLAELGIPYYPGGTDPEHQATHGQPIALQIKAHTEGRNMQFGWWRALYVHVPGPKSSLTVWQQSIARVHRSRQRRDCEVEIRVAIPYHGEVLSHAYARALASTRAAASSHKLVDATWI